MYFPAVGVGGEVERLARFIRPKGHGGGTTTAQPARELRPRKAATTQRRELEDLVAHVVAEQVGAVVSGGPDTVRHEGPSGYGRAPRITVIVLVHRGRVGRGGADYGACTGRVVVGSLAEIPGVVGTCPALVDLLPGVLADIVYKEARTGGIRVES